MTPALESAVMTSLGNSGPDGRLQVFPLHFHISLSQQPLYLLFYHLLQGVLRPGQLVIHDKHREEDYLYPDQCMLSSDQLDAITIAMTMLCFIEAIIKGLRYLFIIKNAQNCSSEEYSIIK